MNDRSDAKVYFELSEDKDEEGGATTDGVEVEVDSLGKEGAPETIGLEGSLEETLMEVFDKARDRKDVLTDGTFSLIDQCLFFSERKSANLRLCFPEAIVPDILNLCHDSCGHPGIRHTYTSIAARYYFRKMSRRIHQHVDNCSRCQLSKPSNEHAMGHLQPIETPSPFHTIGMDFITGLP